MITKKCPACWMDIPLQASKCPYCHTEQPEPTKKELKVWAIVCLLISFALFLGSGVMFKNPDRRERMNPSWEPWYHNNEVPMYIYENDYTQPTCLACGGGVFLIVAGVMYWASKSKD